MTGSGASCAHEYDKRNKDDDDERAAILLLIALLTMLPPESYSRRPMMAAFEDRPYSTTPYIHIVVWLYYVSTSMKQRDETLQHVAP